MKRVSSNEGQRGLFTDDTRPQSHSKIISIQTVHKESVLKIRNRIAIESGTVIPFWSQ